VQEDAPPPLPTTYFYIGDDTDTTNGSLGVVGGSNAQHGDAPWQVSYQVYDMNQGAWRHQCGGSIVAPNLIATAAHCCEGQQGKYMYVLAGAVNKRHRESTQQAIYVNRMVIHPEYNRPT